MTNWSIFACVMAVSTAVATPSGESEVVIWCYSDGYQGQTGAHDRGAV